MTNILKQVGFQRERRLNSEGDIVGQSNLLSDTTNFIPCKTGDTIYLTNMQVPTEYKPSGYWNLVVAYDSSGVQIVQHWLWLDSDWPDDGGYAVQATYENNNITSFVINESVFGSNVASIRMSVRKLYGNSGIYVNERPYNTFTNLANPLCAEWQEDYRLSIGTGGTVALAGHTSTNFIPCKMNDTLRVCGLKITDSSTTASSESVKIVWYKADKSVVGGMYGTCGTSQAKGDYGLAASVDGEVTTYKLAYDNLGNQAMTDTVAYIRIDGILMEGYSKEDVIITINEDIFDATPQKDKYTNQLPLATNADGTLFVGPNGEQGYKPGYRIKSSNGAEEAYADAYCTGFIPIKYGDTIEIQDIGLISNSYNSAVLYDSNHQYLIGTLFSNLMKDEWLDDASQTVFGETWTRTINYGSKWGSGQKFLTKDLDIAYIRFGAKDLTHLSKVYIYPSKNDALASNNSILENYVTLIEQIPIVVTEDWRINAQSHTEVQVAKLKNHVKNWVKYSTEANGTTIYNNGLGYKDGYRVRSGGLEASQGHTTITGYIPFVKGDKLYIYPPFQGLNTTNTVNFYDSSFNCLGQITDNGTPYGICHASHKTKVVNGVSVLDISNVTVSRDNEIAYVRIGNHIKTIDATIVPLIQSGAEMIITKNEKY